MRKISNKARHLQKRRQISVKKKERRAAIILRNAKLQNRKFLNKFKDIYRLIETRKAFSRKLYNKKYIEKPKTVYIEGEFGIEDETRVDYFFKKAVEIIDFENRELTIDLEQCTRVWPSAITMLCSLKQWVELSTRSPGRTTPKIRSTTSHSDHVNSYLKHCGFYEYVKRPTDDVKIDYYSADQVVKIHREEEPSNIEVRENEVGVLLKNYSTLNYDQINLFECTVLIEVLNNVTEHGIAYRDKGWWVLAQYHPKHGFISLCIADNGIGIRNNLMTGRQQSEMGIKDDPLNEGDFIESALTKQISGAILAPRKSKTFLSRRYPPGSHRGNGLKRISEACKNLGIPFAIVSHSGYVLVDKNGKIARKASMHSRVFAGTLYQFIIPAKGGA